MLVSLPSGIMAFSRQTWTGYVDTNTYRPGVSCYSTHEQQKRPDGLHREVQCSRPGIPRAAAADLHLSAAAVVQPASPPVRSRRQAVPIGCAHHRLA